MKKQNKAALWFWSIATVATLLGALACEDGSDGKQGPQGPAGVPAPEPTPTTVSPLEKAPALNVEIVELEGASGPGGEFAAGDSVRIRYRMEKRDGTPWLLKEMTSGIALLSGPTFSYQRVVPAQTDVLTASTPNADGTFSYQLPPIPDVYAAPLNDSASFGPNDGELTGQALLGGTYTVGLSVSWDYTVEGESFSRVGESTRDFLFGLTESNALDPREVTKTENCNQCHVGLRAHEGRFRKMTMCLMCHTVGAEDGNDPNVAGGTPGVTIDSRVLFHKIHNAAHLPSVLGVATSPPAGLRNYAAPPVPLQYITANNTVRDYSSVEHGVFPNAGSPMPRDFGHSALTAAEQALEDQIRSGLTSCFICHGDPDGTGPLTAPSQGDLIEVQPTRAACGGCHDDVDFTNTYQSNLQIMQPQPNDSECTMCHEQTGGQLSVRDAHVHPLRDAFFNPGINFEITDFQEGIGGNGNGVIDPGEGIALTATLRDDAGADLSAASLDSIQAVVSGPTTNSNLVAKVDVPIPLLSGAQPFVFDLPETRLLEFVGDSTAAPGEMFSTAFAPHFNLPGAQTTVFLRTGTAGGSSVLALATAGHETFVDVANAAGFARDDVVVIDDGVAGSEEYLRIQWVEGNRLWFSGSGDPVYAAGPRFGHTIGARVDEVILSQQTLGAQFSLNTAGGTVTEIVEFGAGTAVIVSYSSPFVMPPVYPAPLNASPDLGEAQGTWARKDVVDGTYTVGLWGSMAKTLNFAAENNPYRPRVGSGNAGVPGRPQRCTQALLPDLVRFELQHLPSESLVPRRQGSGIRRVHPVPRNRGRRRQAPLRRRERTCHDRCNGQLPNHVAQDPRRQVPRQRVLLPAHRLRPVAPIPTTSGSSPTSRSASLLSPGRRGTAPPATERPIQLGLHSPTATIRRSSRARSSPGTPPAVPATTRPRPRPTSKPTHHHRASNPARYATPPASLSAWS